MTASLRTLRLHVKTTIGGVHVAFVIPEGDLCVSRAALTALTVRGFRVKTPTGSVHVAFVIPEGDLRVSWATLTALMVRNLLSIITYHNSSGSNNTCKTWRRGPLRG